MYIVILSARLLSTPSSTLCSETISTHVSHQSKSLVDNVPAFTSLQMFHVGNKIGCFQGPKYCAFLNRSSIPSFLFGEYMASHQLPFEDNNQLRENGRTFLLKVTRTNLSNGAVHKLPVLVFWRRTFYCKVESKKELYFSHPHLLREQTCGGLSAYVIS